MSLENKETFETKENNLTELSENEIDKEINTDEKIELSNSYEEDYENRNEDESKTEEQKPKSKSSKIILYIIYAIVIALCIVVLARNLIFKSNKNKTATSSLSSSKSTVINAPEKIKNVYVLADLSDGYKLINQDVSETKAVSTYSNKTNEITLTQSTIDDYEPEYDITDSDMDVSEFHNGAGQEYTAYQIEGKCYIVWTTNEYTFEIKTSLKKSESIPFIFKVQKSEETASSGEPV